MADVFSAKKRSAIMACIHSRGNKDTELRMIALFRIHGITGWRRHADLPGKPDFVWWSKRVAVFVDGCFWHRCPRHGRIPNSRPEYWLPKLARNVARDREVTRRLRADGWTVVRIWECALTQKLAPRTVVRIVRAFRNLEDAGKRR